MDSKYISNDRHDYELLQKIRNMTDEEFETYIQALKEKERASKQEAEPNK